MKNKPTLILKAISALNRNEPCPPECLQMVSNLLSEVAKSQAPAGRPQYVFKQYGKGWLIGDGDPNVYIQSRKKGFEYLHFLLQNPGKPIHALVVYHKGTVDLDGPNLSALNIENVRCNVQKRVKAALKQLQEHHPHIGAHLEYAIDTGLCLSYTQDPSIAPEWDLF